MGYKTVLVPLDGSTLALTAIKDAVKLVRHTGGKIVLLSVVEVPIAQFEGYTDFVGAEEIREQFIQRMTDALATEAKALENEGIEVEAIVRQGTPHEVVSEVCSEVGAEMVVMTTHGRTGMIHFLLGSVAEKVVRSAPCSVMIVRKMVHE